MDASNTNLYNTMSISLFILQHDTYNFTIHANIHEDRSELDPKFHNRQRVASNSSTPTAPYGANL